MTKQKKKVPKRESVRTKTSSRNPNTALEKQPTSIVAGQKAEEKPSAVNSIESKVGYSTLVRILEQTFRDYFRFYTSEEGGSCSPELARAMVFGEDRSAEEWLEHFKHLMSAPVDTIKFRDLLAMNIESPRVAEDMWELIKREARREFESGHQAAESLECLTDCNDAWERARYLGVRESFCREWRPRGGIELSMIDSITQAWLQLQHWTTVLVERSHSEPREENPEFVEWKNTVKRKDVRQWQAGFWDLPNVDQEKAIENAAAMVERWQRMYFRAIRNLRDWRRYSPQLTITNANQVNIGSDGNNQVQING